MNEAEQAALDPQQSSSSPSNTTTAPEGASIEEVQAGLGSGGEEGDGGEEKRYAEGGSLARELAKERREAGGGSGGKDSV